MDDATKTCTKCGQIKAVADFHRNRALPDGRKPHCKPCVRANSTHTRKGPWYGRALAATHRRAALAIYGGKCECCGELRVEFLAFDHIDGGGTAHRREVGSGAAFVRWLRTNDYPAGFRILCHNCNLSRGFLGYCPHETTAQAKALQASYWAAGDPRTRLPNPPIVCPICGTEFRRRLAASAVTCSVKCKGIRQRALTRGERNATSKLTDFQRKEIWRRRAAGEDAVRLANEYGVNRSQIYKIARAPQWGPTS